MEPVKLSETLIGREVELLFKLIPEPRHGCIRMNPVTGRDFVYGVDPIEPQRRRRTVAPGAGIVRLYGPPDAPLSPSTVANVESKVGRAAVGLPRRAIRRVAG